MQSGRERGGVDRRRDGATVKASSGEGEERRCERDARDERGTMSCQYAFLCLCPARRGLSSTDLSHPLPAKQNNRVRNRKSGLFLLPLPFIARLCVVMPALPPSSTTPRRRKRRDDLRLQVIRTTSGWAERRGKKRRSERNETANEERWTGRRQVRVRRWRTTAGEATTLLAHPDRFEFRKVRSSEANVELESSGFCA